MVENAKPKASEKDKKNKYIVNPDQGSPNAMCAWIEENEPEYQLVEWKCVSTIGSMGIRHIAMMKKK